MEAAIWKGFQKVFGKEFAPSHHISSILDKGRSSRKAEPSYHDKQSNASEHLAEDSG
jgi:hypothetical protein